MNRFCPEASLQSVTLERVSDIVGKIQIIVSVVAKGLASAAVECIEDADRHGTRQRSSVALATAQLKTHLVDGVFAGNRRKREPQGILARIRICSAFGQCETAAAAAPSVAL